MEGTQGLGRASGPMPAPTLESQEGFSPPLTCPASCKQNQQIPAPNVQDFQGTRRHPKSHHHHRSPRSNQPCSHRQATGSSQPRACPRLPANLLCHLRACDVQRLIAKQISILACIYLFVHMQGKPLPRAMGWPHCVCLEVKPMSLILPTSCHQVAVPVPPTGGGPALAPRMGKTQPSPSPSLCHPAKAPPLLPEKKTSS